MGGVFDPTIPVSFNLALRLNLAIFKHAWTNGTTTWDWTLNQMTSLALLTATGHRAGDVAVSGQYDACMCLCWKDVQFFFEYQPPPGATTAELYKLLVCRVKLRFVKHYK